MSRKIEEIGQEIVDVAVAIRKGNEDGKIGLVDIWRIMREVKDVIVLLPNIKGIPAELVDMTNEQIKDLVAEMYLQVELSDGENLDRTIDQKNVVHALQGVKSFASITD